MIPLSLAPFRVEGVVSINMANLMTAPASVGHTLIVQCLLPGKIPPLNGDVFLQTPTSVHMHQDTSIGHLPHDMVGLILTHVQAERVPNSLEYFFRPKMWGKPRKPDPNRSYLELF